jgi:hypothetical protein
MARARNIKPGFFKNEELAECSAWARLCFAGLWLLADREGRLEDRPKRIKGELFPFDAFDVEPLLAELARSKFIQRYEIDGQRYIQVSKFSEHQTPHYSEKPSVIKPPGFQESRADEPPPDSKNAPGNDLSLRGGRNPLNPDSLNPDSPKNTSDPDGSAAAQPQAKPLSAKDRVWLLGVPLLGDTKANRGLLAKLAKTYTDEVLAKVLAEATADPPIEPKSWIVAACETAKAAAPRVNGHEPPDLLAGDPRPDWAIRAGFSDRWQAESHGCGPGNAAKFSGGRRVSE